MRPLEQLNNVERAKLLHDLFKPEIPAALQFARNTVTMLRENEEDLKAQWENGFFTFTFWLNLANCVAGKIDHYRAQLEKNGRLFSE